MQCQRALGNSKRISPHISSRPVFLMFVIFLFFTVDVNYLESAKTNCGYPVSIPFTVPSDALLPVKIYVYQDNWYGEQVFHKLIRSRDDLVIRGNFPPGEYISIICPMNKSEKYLYRYGDGPAFKISEKSRLTVENTATIFYRNMNVSRPDRMIKMNAICQDLVYRWECLEDADYYEFHIEIVKVKNKLKVGEKSINECISFSFVDADQAQIGETIYKGRKEVPGTWYRPSIPGDRIEPGYYLLYWYLEANSRSHKPFISSESGIDFIEILK